MTKSTVGNLLLVAGTVLSGLSAANSERASRALALEPGADLSGEFLFADVGEGYETEPLAPRGAELVPELVARLREAGIESVAVKNPPIDSERLPVGDGSDVAGRVLSAEVATGEGDDDVLPAGRFLDEAAVRALVGAEIAEVEVAISREFTLAGWDYRWGFLGGIALMLGGIALKRSGARAAVVDDGSGDHVGPERMREWAKAFAAAVEELSGRVDQLSCPDIYTSLDPLFAQYGQPFVEHREVLRTAYGGAGFAHIMGPFASAERRLNRAWSSAVDGYVEEAQASVKAAVPYLKEVIAAFPA